VGILFFLLFNKGKKAFVGYSPKILTPARRDINSLILSRLFYKAEVKDYAGAIKMCLLINFIGIGKIDCPLKVYHPVFILIKKGGE